MKVCFLVPDGTGIRNYLYSRLISELPKGTEVLIWHNISDRAIAETRKIHSGVPIVEERIPVYIEGITERVLREASTYARLHWSAALFENQTIVTNWYRPRKTLKRKLLFKAAETVGRHARHDYKRIRILEKKYIDLISREKVLAPYTSFLKKHQPDIIFCTHQRISWLIPAIEAARKLKIKTATAIYSWDNIPKARLSLRTDKFVVWSDYMKHELNLFYPEIPMRDIVVTGSPQFEFYKDLYRLWPREEFTGKFGLSFKQQFICYTGDDSDISPYDQLYLEDLAEAVSQIEPDKRPHIIFRRSPADFSDRYNKVLAKYGAIITSIDPLWQSDSGKLNWASYYPLPSDIDLLVNLAYHCDISVNIASTIAHDFATFDKPTFYFNYDQFKTDIWSVKTIYRFQHFRSMDGYAAVGWITSKASIKELILKALDDPHSISPDKEKWLHKIVTPDFQNASQRIAEFFLSINHETFHKEVLMEAIRY